MDKSSGRYRPSHGYNHHVHPRPHHQFDYEGYHDKPLHPVVASPHHIRQSHHLSHHHHSDLKPVIVPGISLDGYDKVVPFGSKYRKVRRTFGALDRCSRTCLLTEVRMVTISLGDFALLTNWDVPLPAQFSFVG